MKGIYQSLPSQDVDEDDTREKAQSRPLPRSQASKLGCLLVLNVVFFLGAWVVLFLAWRGWMLRPRHVIEQLSPYSPILGSIPIEFQTMTVRGTLFDDYDPHIIYRQPPSDEVDKAWDEISDIQYIAVNEDAMRKLGKDTDLGVKFPEDWGLGQDMYMVQLDSQHQLHCLNQLRQYIYFDHYYAHRYTNLSTMPLRHQAHISHCLDILLQALTCMPSLDLISHQWMETQERPYPDFNIKRQCMNHAALLEWQKGVAVTKVFTEPGGVPQPPGAKQIPPELSISRIGDDLGS